MKTCAGKHDLEEIMANRLASIDGWEVTRWCRACGAIVIDVDVDGRIYAGRQMALKLPENARAIAAKEAK